MSYNIDTWKTKDLHDFRIAMHALKEVKGYLHSPSLNIETGVLHFTGRAEGFELQGKQEGDWLLVSHLESYGESSDTMQEYLKERILPHTTGRLCAVLVWEGGDTIERLTVQDGTITEEEIEL